MFWKIFPLFLWSFSKQEGSWRERERGAERGHFLSLLQCWMLLWERQHRLKPLSELYPGHQFTLLARTIIQDFSEKPYLRLGLENTKVFTPGSRRVAVHYLPSLPPPPTPLLFSPFLLLFSILPLSFLFFPHSIPFKKLSILKKKSLYINLPVCQLINEKHCIRREQVTRKLRCYYSEQHILLAQNWCSATWYWLLSWASL